MKLRSFSFLLLLAVGFTAFVSSCKKEETTPADTRFESVKTGSDNMETIIDTETNLEWVNDNRGCFGGIIEPSNECMESTFAGHEDWRTPTAAELSTLIKAINERDMKLNYINSSCALMSTSAATWVFTENAAEPGNMTTMKPGNAGLRCVRKK